MIVRDKKSSNMGTAAGLMQDGDAVMNVHFEGFGLVHCRELI
jgi:hypothetical protein